MVQAAPVDVLARHPLGDGGERQPTGRQLQHPGEVERGTVGRDGGGAAGEHVGQAGALPQRHREHRATAAAAQRHGGDGDDGTRGRVQHGSPGDAERKPVRHLIDRQLPDTGEAVETLVARVAGGDRPGDEARQVQQPQRPRLRADDQQRQRRNQQLAPDQGQPLLGQPGHPVGADAHGIRRLPALRAQQELLLPVHDLVGGEQRSGVVHGEGETQHPTGEVADLHQHRGPAFPGRPAPPVAETLPRARGGQFAYAPSHRPRASRARPGG
ncbi:hypothetical protein ACFQZC_12600 [Streptacidiphilus monticola]